MLNKFDIECVIYVPRVDLSRLATRAPTTNKPPKLKHGIPPNDDEDVVDWIVRHIDTSCNIKNAVWLYGYSLKCDTIRSAD